MFYVKVQLIETSLLRSLFCLQWHLLHIFV